MTPRDATRRALSEGSRLFDAGRFFEAHEVWEAAWLLEDGSARELLQGLIQIAAGYHQAFDRRHARGCARLLEAGAARLDGLDSAAALGALGVDRPAPLLDAFRRAVASDLDRARAWDRGEAPAPSREEAPHLGLAKE